MTTNDERTGLLASIFKSDGRSYSNGGVSATHDEVLVVGSGITGPFNARPGLPMVEIVPGNIGGLKAVPVGPRPEGSVGPMFGGTFVWSTDARFRRISETPVPLHDRYETLEQYRRLSS